MSEPLKLPTGQMPRSALGNEASAVRERLRRDLQALTLFLLPHLSTYSDNLSWIETQTGLTSDDIRELRRTFLRLGWWRINVNGRTEVSEARFALGEGKAQSLTLPELFTMLPQVLGRLSEDGPCWYAAHTVATNQKLKAAFYRDVNTALEKLLTASANEPADTLVSWAHAGLDIIQSQTIEDNS